MYAHYLAANSVPNTRQTSTNTPLLTLAASQSAFTFFFAVGLSI